MLAQQGGGCDLDGTLERRRGIAERLERLFLEGGSPLRVGGARSPMPGGSARTGYGQVGKNTRTRRGGVNSGDSQGRSF